ncbi:hypothetical protein KAW38_03540 [Candidatus Micrarchaeota archaeon]|nr:hypothetical protein [Candidatus Micrarchaeota archaeon]
MAKVCLISKKEVKEGYPIIEDPVVQTIRKIKKRFGLLQNNEIVVSPEHLETYKKKREAFERNLVIYSAVAIIVVVVFSTLPIILSGTFNFMAVLYSFLLGIMIVLFALMGYLPQVDTGKVIKPAGKEARKPAKKKR